MKFYKIETSELYHYGVKGMKWGVRRLDKKNGDLYLKKGSVVKRVTTLKDDTRSDRRYVSINQKDHDKWDDFLGDANVKFRNSVTYVQTYKTTKDLKIMSKEKQGQMFAEMILNDPKFKKQAIKDIDQVTRDMGQKFVDDYAENISRNIAWKTKTGEAFVKKAIENNYDAIFDTHGTMVSDNPIIVLNPNSNLAKYAEPEYTKYVKDYLKRTYGISAKVVN